MIAFKCKMCGGDVDIKDNESIGTCKSCGSKMTIPRLDTQKRTNLYNRANHFRLLNEFDEATRIYEMILDEDGTDAEAYWGLVLCHYGIEYVEDPKTKLRKPTLHRMQKQLITQDAHYLLAIEHAMDGYTRSFYQQEAAVIQELQKGILQVASQVEHFDVFICYKEETETGQRTKDSVIAEEIYETLTEAGFKVFYARKTLENYLGNEYEPIIFSALESARVMLVVATNVAYVESVWVKNEWSRFIKHMEQDPNRVLIPCYQDIDIYELPEQLAVFQGQEVTKIGFIQDVLKALKRQGKENKPMIEQPIQTQVLPTGGSLSKRIAIFLEDGDFTSASEYIERLLDLDAENGKAYVFRLMVEFQCKVISDLQSLGKPFNDSPNYQKIMRFGDDELVKQISDMNQKVIDHYNSSNQRIRDLIEEAKLAYEEKRYGDVYKHYLAIEACKQNPNMIIPEDFTVTIPPTTIVVARMDIDKKLNGFTGNIEVTFKEDAKRFKCLDCTRDEANFIILQEENEIEIVVKFSVLKEVEPYQKTLRVPLGHKTLIKLGVERADRKNKFLLLYIKTSTEDLAVVEQTVRKNACFVASYVYGSYDAPEVWILRHFRDDVLNQSIVGKWFVKTYYLVSPKLIKMLGHHRLFKQINRFLLDRLVHLLRKYGIH